MTPAAPPAANERSRASVAPGEPLIQFNNIRLSSEGYEVLRGVSLAVQPGETKILLGETGTGKTVLMKMAAGLIHPDEGNVVVMGHDVTAMSEKDLLQFRKQMGFVFQEGALFDSMDVADNVSFRLHEENSEEEDEIHQRVVESLKFVEMEHAIDRFPAELSGGMRRRVSIARALIDKPPIVFYDSPTAGLDPVTSQTIINLILRGRDLQDVTSMLATHRVQDAFGLANYTFDKSSGKVLHSGTMEMSEDGTRVVPTKSNAGSGKDAQGHRDRPTNVVVLHEGVIYFEGDMDDLLKTDDPYLKKFLASAE